MEGATTADASPAASTHERRPLSPLHVGIMCWLASDVMFFAGLFATWFVLRAENPTWPPEGFELDVVRSGIFTLVLVSSSFTIHFCVKAAEAGDRGTSIGWLLVTFVLGAVFLANQILEYTSLDFTWTDEAYGSIYYLLTGFHGLHVLGGLTVMVILLFMLVPLASKAPLGGSVTAFSYYWHFVDVVWVVVFVVVYLIQ